MTVASPCVHICQMHPEGYCIGCFRSKFEIQFWFRFDETKKQETVDACAVRRELFKDDRAAV